MNDLIIQGPDATAAQSEKLAQLSGASQTLALGGNAYRLRAPRTPVAALDACAALKIDAALVPANRRLGDFGLLAMDMDSTLITIECIDELADLAGPKSKVAAVTAAAMRGEIDFPESLRRRVALLKDLPVSALERVYWQRLHLSPGAERLITRLQSLGIKTLLVSGGFDFFVDRLKQRLGLDYAHANALEILDGRLTGKIQGPVFDAQGKVAALREACAELGISTKQSIVLGDGANDLAMMAAAGISIAYHAKPVVRDAATHALDYSGLDGVLNLFDPDAAAG